jgi:hypothetical protein
LRRWHTWCGRRHAGCATLRCQNGGVLQRHKSELVAAYSIGTRIELESPNDTVETVREWLDKHQQSW